MPNENPYELSVRESKSIHRQRWFSPWMMFALLTVMAATLGSVAYNCYYYSHCSVCYQDSHGQNFLRMASIEQAAKGFYLKTGQRPQSIEDLIVRPNGMSQQEWQGPYLDCGGQIPTDPWGNAYSLQIERNFDSIQIVVSSSGPNGILGDADDLTTMPVPQNNQ